MAINTTVENINNQPTIQPQTVTGIFTKYIAKTLPLAFDESMSYYECICALLEYLNETIVPDINNTNAGLGELQTFYEELQSYVNNYFDNLDVQNEINIKLDEMALDGTLTGLIKNYLDPYINDIQTTVDNQNALIQNINAKVTSAVSGSPIAVSSTDLMTDTTKIYLLTTNGYWYYYNGTTWTQGGLYQTSVSNDDVIYLEKKDNSLNYDVPIRYDITMKNGYRLTQSQGIEYAQEGYSCSPYIPYNGVYKNRFYNVLDATASTEIIAFYDEDYTFISYEPLNLAHEKINLIAYPSNTHYIRFCLQNEHIDDDIYITQQLYSNRRINEMNTIVNELDLVNVFNKNIKTNYEIGEVVPLSPENAIGYKYIILDCESHQIFAINGTGGSNPRLWAFVDKDNKLLEKSAASKQGLEIITAPTNAKKLICNFNITSPTPVDEWDSCYVYNLSKSNLETIMNGYNLAENTGVSNQNIKTNYDVGEIVDLTPESVINYTYIIINCKALDQYVVSGHGGENPRLWAFLDSSNHLLMKADSIKSGTEIITAPTNAAKLICNFQTIYEYSVYNLNQLTIKNLNARVNEIEEKTATSNYLSLLTSPENYGCCYIRSLRTSYYLNNHLTDFKKPSDLMCHVGTFKIINGNVYVTYYGSETVTYEDPTTQIVRFVKAPLNNLSNKTYYTIQEVGDTFDNHTVTAIYDTVLMTIDNDDLYIMWTAQLDGVYTRLYQVYNITSDTFGNISYNYFKVGNTTGIFNTTNMRNNLDDNNIPHKNITIDIGLMQKVTSRIENGTTYYYTGCYAGEFNCIVKSTNLITWEYVTAPTFEDNSLFENACYVKGDKIFYFIRQDWKYNYGLLSYYDLSNNTWHEPVKVNDCQSRSDFFEDNVGILYLVHANDNRDHITITKIDTQYLTFSSDRIDSRNIQCFYPYVDKYNNELYMIYTQARQHMYFVKFDLGVNDEYIIQDLYNRLY